MFNILEIIEQYFAHHIIFSAGLLLIAGYIFGQLAEKLKARGRFVDNLYGIIALNIFFTKGII